MLEPAMVDFIKATDAFYPEDTASRGIAEQRAIYDAYCRAFTPPRPAGVVAEDAVLALPGRDLAIRAYRRVGLKPKGTIVYLHGGGFVVGGLDSHDVVTAHLAAVVDAVVVAIEYRLAPEHPFPAAFDDGLALIHAVSACALPFAGLVPCSPVVLIGDSAGASLSATIASHLRGDATVHIVGQVLIYPALAADPTPPARDDEAFAPMLTLADARWYRDTYHAGAIPDARSVPLLAADFAGLPPTLLLPVEHDPLRDDARAYADRLREAGVEVDCVVGSGLVHGCLRALHTSPGAGRLVARAAEAAARWIKAGQRAEPASVADATAAESRNLHHS